MAKSSRRLTAPGIAARHGLCTPSSLLRLNTMGQEIEAVGVEMKAQRPGAAQVVENRAHEPEEWNVVELAAEDTGDEGVAMDPEVSPEADVDETVATRLRLELERVSLDGDLPGVVRVITQLETALLDMEDHRLAK